MDIGHELTSKQLLALQKRLAKEYATAEREMRKKLKKHMDKFASELEDKQKLLDNGKIDEAKFLEWKRSRLMRSADMQTMIDDYVNERVKANQKAAAIINGSLPEAYAENYNYGTYQVEKSIKMDTAFTLHNKNAVKNLQARATINVAKDRAWHNRKINSALTQGIMQGESIPKIQRRLLNIGIMDENAAMRNARTMMTSAQNEGRLDSYRRAADLGIKLKKTWIATIDDRVRDSHAEIDGETVPIDEPFSNGLMYPADPDGDPAEVYGCRCTMIVQIAGFERDVTDSGLRPAQIGSYDEWKAAHAKKAFTEQPAVKAAAVMGVGEKINANLADAYEYHRIKNNLNETPFDDDLKTAVTASFKNLSEESARAFEDTLTDLMAEYDTPLQMVRSMTKEEAFWGLDNSFAAVGHNYSLDSAELLINPLKCKDYQKMIDRIEELSEDGYCVKIAKGKAKEYVATHEFAHTLVDMESTLSNKRNWVNADYAKVKTVRKEIKAIYDDYLKEIQPIEEKAKELELDYLLTFDEKSADQASKLYDKLGEIKLSDYSLESADEFMAEAFTFARIGKGKNKYADKVKRVLDKYYKR